MEKGLKPAELVSALLAETRNKILSLDVKRISLSKIDAVAYIAKALSGIELVILETISDQALDFSDKSYALLNARAFVLHDSNPRAEQGLKVSPISRDLVLKEAWAQGSCT
jgi:hypothetical protein